jgi:archaemetzincin
MKKRPSLLLVLLLLLAVALFGRKYLRHGVARFNAQRAEWSIKAPENNFRDSTQKLIDLHEPLGEPEPGMWLHSQFEPGQTFAQYTQANPIRPNKDRFTIYVQPLGKLNKKQREIIKISSDFIGLYYDCPMRILPDMPDSVIEPSAQRIHPGTKEPQFLSTFILDKVLAPKLPDDALAYIAFTATDLYPQADWNYVFGQASIKARVGVWSLARYGDPAESDAAYHLALERTLKVATHETGHMLSMYHCTEFLCNMCGSNSLKETDQHPLWLCPTCLAKVHWGTRTDPVERFEKLAQFCDEHGFAKESEYYKAAKKRWSSKRQ